MTQSGRGRRLAVVAAALIDGEGRVLIAQRPKGHHHAGLWEFPGGKREAAESPVQALARELREELGIKLEDAAPLIRVPFDLGSRAIVLDAYQVTGFHGQPQAHEHQALRWVAPDELKLYSMPGADRPVAAALYLPDRIAVTPAELTDPALITAGVQALLAQGFGLIQLRCPGLSQTVQRELAAGLLPAFQRQAAKLLLNGDIEGAERLGCSLHLRSQQLQQIGQRPRLAAGQSLSAACHHRADLDRAESLHADFAVLGSVNPTASHPGRPALGWAGFAELRALSSLPIYAIGGLAAGQIGEARRQGAQGVAAIRAFWPVR